MPRPMGPPVGASNDKYKEPLPKNIKEVPQFVKNVVKQFFSHLFYIFGLVWDTGKWIAISMMVIAVLQGILPVVTAWIGADILNMLSEAYTAIKTSVSYNFAVVLTLLVIQFVCIFVNSILSRVNTVITRMAGELVVNHITLMMITKAKDVDLQSYDKPEFYERLENASREAGMRPLQILSATFSAISAIISMISFFVILCGISPAAPLLILILALPSAVVSIIYRKKNFSYVRFRSKDRRQLSYYSGLMTNKDMVKEIKIFGLSDTLKERYQATFRQYYKGLKSLYIKEGIWNVTVSLISSFVNCALFLVVAKLVADGKIMVGDYSLYTGALNSISSGVTSLITTFSIIYEGTLFIENLITFMNEKKKVVPIIDNPLPVKRHIGHRIELKNVSFCYPNTEKYVIKNFSAVIEPGSTIVLVGLNGAGKTTLIKLITRLYDPTEGVILLDGHDIREYNTEQLYEIFGIIFQDFGKYAVSAAENIEFGWVSKTVDMNNVINAAVMGNSDDFINHLPNGYDTQLTRYFDDNGIELSIGQWQKLSISRAFYSDSDILILDEPTASLDAIAEQEIYNQFDLLRKDKTTIFVSHRLSSATVADNILVMDNGQLVEQGNHENLMDKKGIYYKLFSTQAKRYVDSSNKEQERK